MQIIINAFVGSIMLAALAIAFSILYLSTKYFIIELGAVFVISPFILKSFLEYNIPFFPALLMTLFFASGISMMAEVFNHSRLEKKNASNMAHLITSLGIYIFITQLVAIVWTSESQFLQKGIDVMFNFSRYSLTNVQIISVIFGLSLVVIYLALLNHSNAGLIFRAISDNKTELSLRGYNVDKIKLVLFALSGLIVSSISICYAYDVGFDAHGGLNVLIYAIIAVIVGGKESFYGPIVGSVILIIFQTAAVWFISVSWMDAVTFLLFAIFLFIRPNGIMAGIHRIEVSK